MVFEVWDGGEGVVQIISPQFGEIKPQLWILAKVKKLI